MNSTDLMGIVEQNPVPTAVTAASAVALLVLAVVAGRRLVRMLGDASAENVLTVVAAGIATSVAAQGMWQFFGDVLHFSGPLRALTFAFIEVSVMTSAVRARASMRTHGTAGVDGIAVWVLTCLSAVLSSLDAKSAGEFVFRLAAPLVAAWLWERGMALERRRRTGRKSINWRLSPERVLVRLGLADPTDRTASEVDTHRRLLRLALAAKRARAAKGWRRTRALKRLDKTMEGAVSYGGLGTDQASQEMLMATLGVLFNTADLVALRPPAPWQSRPVATGRAPEGIALPLRPLDNAEWWPAFTPERASVNGHVGPVATGPRASLAGAGPQVSRTVPEFGESDEDPDGALDPGKLAIAREKFAEVLATGGLPSVNQIRKACNVGHPKAVQIREALAAGDWS